MKATKDGRSLVSFTLGVFTVVDIIGRLLTCCHRRIFSRCRYQQSARFAALHSSSGQLGREDPTELHIPSARRRTLLHQNLQRSAWDHPIQSWNFNQGQDLPKKRDLNHGGCLNLSYHKGGDHNGKPFLINHYPLPGPFCKSIILDFPLLQLLHAHIFFLLFMFIPIVLLELYQRKSYFWKFHSIRSFTPHWPEFAQTWIFSSEPLSSWSTRIQLKAHNWHFFHNYFLQEEMCLFAIWPSMGGLGAKKPRDLFLNWTIRFAERHTPRIWPRGFWTFRGVWQGQPVHNRNLQLRGICGTILPHPVCQETSHSPRLATASIFPSTFDFIKWIPCFLVEPASRPTVSGFKSRYQIGDSLEMDCFINSTFPSANITWFINNEMVKLWYIFIS